MPIQKTPRRITKSAVRPSRPAMRRTVKARSSRPAPQPASDALLIAQFAEALGQSSRKPTRAKRRSLAEALQQAAPRGDVLAGDVLAIMPGARVVQHASVAGAASEVPAPCLAAARRRHINGRVSGAASWCVAFLVTAGIVSAAAYGFVSNAPVRSIAAITTASAAQF